MGPLFGGAAWPLGCEVGFLERPVRDVLGATKDWYRKLGRRWTETSLGPQPLLTELLALAPLQMPARRELIVGTTGNWTMHVSNSRGGGDSIGWVGHLSGMLRCHGIAARHVPQSQDPYPSTQFEYLGPEGVPPLHYIRTVSAGIYDEERWRFLANGPVQPFEKVDRYGARRIRDRFDRSLLIEYLAALGIRADDPDFFTAATLIDQGPLEQQWSASLEEARAERLRPWPGPMKVSADRRGGAITLVDGHRIYPGTLGLVEQLDAYTGGHRYTLELVAPEHGKLPPDLQNLSQVGTAERVRQILRAADEALATYGYKNTDYDFLVNTVESAKSDESSVSIAGVCSCVER